jgi:hypothetical protein
MDKLVFYRNDLCLIINVLSVDCRNVALVRNGLKLRIHVPDHHTIFQNSFIFA